MAEFLISLPALERNARILDGIARESGARMLLALKAFSTTSCFSAIRPYVAGCCASGGYEARLAEHHMGGHVAVYSPAYRPAELEELLSFAHHIDFNSLPQWQRYREQCLRHPRVQSGQLLLKRRPLFLGVDADAVVQALEDDEVLAQGFPQLDGEDQTSLGVDIMLILASHRSSPPF